MSSFNKTRGSIYISIRSKDMINTSSGINGNAGRFILFEPINCLDNEVLSVSLTSCTFANSWRNLSESTKNNLLTFIESGTSYTIQIPDGNYSINELLAVLKPLMESANSGNIIYTFSYDDITNRVKIMSNSATITTFKFSFANSIRRFLGFNNADINLNSFTTLYSNRAVDVTDSQNSIYIRVPNLSNQKIIESSTGKYSNILAQVPIVFSRNAFFVYEPSVPFDMQLSSRTINSIDIVITYQDEKIPINFNNAEWEINLKVDFYNKPESKKREIKLHKDMISKFDIYKKTEMDKNRRLEELKNLKKLKQN